MFSFHLHVSTYAVLPEAPLSSNGSSNGNFPPDGGSPPGNFSLNRPLPDDQPPPTVATGHGISKRHGEAGGPGLQSKKDIRCWHISAPVQVQLMKHLAL